MSLGDYSRPGCFQGTVINYLNFVIASVACVLRRGLLILPAGSDSDLIEHVMLNRSTIVLPTQYPRVKLGPDVLSDSSTHMTQPRYEILTGQSVTSSTSHHRVKNTVDTVSRGRSAIAERLIGKCRVCSVGIRSTSRIRGPPLEANKVRRLCTCTFFLAVQALPLQDNFSAMRVTPQVVTPSNRRPPVLLSAQRKNHPSACPQSARMDDTAATTRAHDADLGKSASGERTRGGKVAFARLASPLIWLFIFYLLFFFPSPQAGRQADKQVGR